MVSLLDLRFGAYAYPATCNEDLHPQGKGEAPLGQIASDFGRFRGPGELSENSQNLSQSDPEVLHLFQGMEIPTLGTLAAMDSPKIHVVSITCITVHMIAVDKPSNFRRSQIRLKSQKSVHTHL